MQLAQKYLRELLCFYIFAFVLALLTQKKLREL